MILDDQYKNRQNCFFFFLYTIFPVIVLVVYHYQNPSPLTVCVKWIVLFLCQLWLTNFPFGYLTCETFSVESGDLFCCLQLVVQERNSVCSILKLSLYSVTFKPCSEGEETSPLFPKLLANFQQFSNIYKICWPCIVFFFNDPFQYSQVCLGTYIVTEICNILECSVTFVALRAIWTCTNTN